MSKACTVITAGGKNYGVSDNLSKILKKKYNWTDEQLAWVVNNYINVTSNDPWSFDTWFGNWQSDTNRKKQHLDEDGNIRASAVIDYLNWLQDITSQQASIKFPDGFELNATDSLMLVDGLIVKLMQFIAEEDFNRAFMDRSGKIFKLSMMKAIMHVLQDMAAARNMYVDQFNRLKATNASEADRIRVANRIEKMDNILERLDPAKKNYSLSLRMLLEAELSRIGVSFDSLQDLDEATRDYNTIIDELTNEEFDSEEGNETDLGSNRDSMAWLDAFEFDTKTGAPKSIKMLIRGLPQFRYGRGMPVEERNELGLIKSVDYSSTFNKILSAGAGAVNSWEDLDKQLQGLFQVERNSQGEVIRAEGLEIEYLRRIINTDRVDSTTGYNYGELLRTQAVQQFGLYNYPFMMDTLDKEGAVQVSNANTNRSTELTKREWRNNLIANLKTITSEELLGFLKGFANSTTPGKHVKLAQYLGMNITQDQMEEVIRGKTGVEMKVYEVLNAIVGSMARSNVTEIVNELYSKSSAVASRIEMLAKHFDIFDDVDHQHSSPDGKIKYNINLHTFLTSYVSRLNKFAGDEEGLRRNFPELFTSFNRTGTEFATGWVRHLIEGGTIEVQVLEGLIEKNGRGEVTKRLTPPSLYAMRMANTHKGMYTLIRAADRGVENMLYLNGVNRPSVTNKAAARTYLISRLKDELRFINEYSEDINVKYYKEKGKSLAMFGWLTNENERSESLNSALGGAVISIEDLNKANLSTETSEFARGNANLNERVFNMIDKYLDWAVNSEMDYMAEQGAKVPTNLLKEYDGNVQAAVGEFVFSNMQARMEMMSFIGPLQFFKNADELFKRMSMVNSSKRLSRVDNKINDQIFEEFSKSSLEKNAGISEEVMLDIAGGTIRTINLQDEVINLEEYNNGLFKQLEQAFRFSIKNEDNKDGLLSEEEVEQKVQDLLEPYREFEATDGMGYLTLDEYKRAKLRDGTWFPSHEEVYQKIVKGEEITPNEVARFTMLKYQYTGKLMNHLELNAPAVRKFAFLPLIPSIIPAGSRMEGTYNKMLKNGIGMAFYPSAAKVGLGHVFDHSEIPQFIPEEQIDMLHYNFMGNQVNINEEEKELTTASTQKHKLLTVDLFSGGKIRIKELAEPIGNYYGAYGEKVRRAANELFGELFGLEENEGAIISAVSNSENIDIDRLVSTLLDQAIQRNGHTNVLASIARIREEKYLDLSASRQDIEYMLASMFRQRVQRRKRPGTSAPQASFSGLEEQLFVNNDLKFYERSARTGETLPMQLITTLPSYLRPVVRRMYGNVSQETIDKFNDDIAHDESLLEMYHNNEIEEEELVSQLRIDPRIRTVVGFRIPNQSQASSEVARVTKYLNPVLGETAIVPKALVAKAGSDFDIDKMNLYYPRLDKKGRYIAGRQYTLTGELDLANLTEYQLDNVMLESEIEIMTHKKNFRPLMAPISNKLLSRTAANIRKMRTGQSSKALHMHEVFLNHVDVHKFMSFLAGKTGVGQTAVHIVHHSIAQKTGLSIANLGFELFPSGLPEGGIVNDKGELTHVSMAHVTSIDGNRISETLSEFITAYVDVAKDDYIFDMNMVTTAANVGLMLVRSGLALEDVVLFLNHHAVRKYISSLDFHRSPMNMKQTSPFRDAYNETVLGLDLLTPEEKKSKTTKKNPYFDSAVSKLQYPTANGESRIGDAVDEGGNLIPHKFAKAMGWKNLSRAALVRGVQGISDPAVDRQIVDMFNVFSSLSREFQKKIKMDSEDTARFRTYKALQEEVVTPPVLKILNPVEKADSGMFENIRESKVKLYNIWEDMMLISDHPTVSHIIGAVNRSYDIPYNRKDRIKQMVIGEAQKAMLYRPIQVGDEIYQAITRKEALELFNGGPRDIATRAMALRKKYKNNKFLENIIPFLNSGPRGSNHIVMKNVTHGDHEAITDGLLELKSSEPAFYNDVVKAALVQGFFYSTFNNLLSVVPEGDIYALREPYIRAIVANPYTLDQALSPADFAFEFLIENAGRGTYGLEYQAGREIEYSLYDAINSMFLGSSLKRSKFDPLKPRDSLRVAYDSRNKQYVVAQNIEMVTIQQEPDAPYQTKRDFSTPIVNARPTFGGYGSAYGLLSELRKNNIPIHEYFQEISRRKLSDKEEACRLKL